MSLVNKVFKIAIEDEELIEQFPEMKRGTEFTVLETEARDLDYKDGITSIQIKDGPVLTIADRDDVYFWCFYCATTMHQLKEVKPKDKLVIGHHKGRLIEHSLYELAEKSDYEDYETGLMKAAADYIHWLEAQLRFADKAF